MLSTRYNEQIIGRILAIFVVVASMSPLPLPFLSMLLLPTSHGLSQCRQQPPMKASVTRRVASTGILFSPFVVAGAGTDADAVNRPNTNNVAFAFDNGVPEMQQYRHKTKFPGFPPKTLGMGSDGRLAACDDGLNCFSTTRAGSKQGLSDNDDDVHLLEPWRPKEGTNRQNALTELVETVRSYPPGQARVDRGGFEIVTIDPENGYLYVRFESMKHGFIDDVEFAVSTLSSSYEKGEKKRTLPSPFPSPVRVQVRSSSRIGLLDLGVNAKRLNWISADLRSKGWTAPAITPEDYPDYFGTLVFTFDDYIRSVLSPKDCPVPSEPATCKDPSFAVF